MGWVAHLECPCCGQDVGDWGATHNINPMANAVIMDWPYGQEVLKNADLLWWSNRDRFDVVEKRKNSTDPHGSWWQVLDGMSAKDGYFFLTKLISTMDSDRARFLSMNPENGWGDFVGFFRLLQQMAEMAKHSPNLQWVVNG